jgi:CheY-like chemotaxis protein
VRHEPEAEAEARRNAAVDKATIQASLGGVKVLVIDDEEDSVGTIKRILERHGAEVRGVYSMEEGLQEFTQFGPNVVLSDIGMPEHDGYELIARLRKLPGGRSVPAVALTALARSDDRTRALRAGFQLHVAKPVDFNELVAVVQNLAALRAG